MTPLAERMAELAAHRTFLPREDLPGRVLSLQGTWERVPGDDGGAMGWAIRLPVRREQVSVDKRVIAVEEIDVRLLITGQT